jgi:hypothetical protein
MELKEKEIKRDIKISILEGKYKCICAYEIPRNILDWFKCPNCNLYPLVWEYNNGSSTSCGCGESIYNGFSIYTESIMSYINRNNGSVMGHDSDKLRKNWNHWVETGKELEPRKKMLEEGKW